MASILHGSQSPASQSTPRIDENLPGNGALNEEKPERDPASENGGSNTSSILQNNQHETMSGVLNNEGNHPKVGLSSIITKTVGAQPDLINPVKPILSVTDTRMDNTSSSPKRSGADGVISPKKPVLAFCPPQQYPYNRIQSTCSSLGRYLARRLVQIGISDVFSVPGDFNLVLLDHLLSEPSLNLVGCCNELNAGYAADGYARAKGVGACVVTFTVGGLSIVNAIAGAYSENLPVICIVGGPNSNDYGTNRILHHTVGLPDFSQELRCFQQVTCCQVCSDKI